MALILLRHTTPDVASGICYGQLDLDVAPGFESEAELAISRLPAFERIVTSPLMRCRKLADLIGQEKQLSVKDDARLMEIDFGTWEGRAWSDIDRGEVDAWAKDFYYARPHGGESVAMLQSRVLQALTDYEDDIQTTLIVTHAGVIRAALAEDQTAASFDTRTDFGAFRIISGAWEVCT